MHHAWRGREQWELRQVNSTPATCGDTAADRLAAGGSTAAAAAPQPADSPDDGGTPVVLKGNLAAARSALPADVASMSIADMQRWVTDHQLEDEEFMQLAARRGKKGEWLEYVKKRAGVGGAAGGGGGGDGAGSVASGGDSGGAAEPMEEDAAAAAVAAGGGGGVNEKTVQGAASGGGAAGPHWVVKLTVLPFGRSEPVVVESGG